MERLADIVDTRKNGNVKNKPPIPPCSGRLIMQGEFSLTENARYNSAMLSSRFQLDHLLVQGSSGSGKSTLLKLLTRLYEPSEGVIRIDGHDISKVDLYSRPNRCGAARPAA